MYAVVHRREHMLCEFDICSLGRTRYARLATLGKHQNGDFFLSVVLPLGARVFSQIEKKNMNPEKLKKLQSQVRIGGKGTPRRKKKILHSTPATDDKKLQSSLKKLSVNTIPGIEEVNIIKNDGTVIHFNNPKAQASLPTNTFAITGHGENKTISEMLPGILTQLGPQDITQLKKIASEFASKGAAATAAAAGAGGAGAAADGGDDDVPDLVQNFEEVAIGGAEAASAESTAESAGAAKKVEEVPSASA